MSTYVVELRNVDHGPGADDWHEEPFCDVVDDDGDATPLPPAPLLESWAWGFPGANALRTAESILRHHMGGEPTLSLARSFRDEVIALLPHEGGEITDGQVALWLLGWLRRNLFAA